MFKQSNTSAPARVDPPKPERTRSDKQASPPETIRVVNIPSPAGITAPANENPRTTPELDVETVKPASSAVPPDAPKRVAPVTLNDNSSIGASSVITKNVPKKTLALTRAKQIEIKNYKRK